MPVNKKWSLKHKSCRKCGTKEIKHKARGLCANCYNRETENRQKTLYRKRGTASKKLTKEYLLDEYWIKKKSLNDIAKNCACTRQK